MLSVVLCKTERGRLCGSCLKVVQVAVHLLIVGQTLTHMVEHFLGKLLRFFMGKILADPLCVESSLVHTDKSDGREVVGKGSEISLGIRIQPLVEKLCDDGTLDLERTSRNIHHVVKSLEEIFLVLSKVCDSGHVDGNNTDRTGALTASKEATRLLTQLAEVQAQTAAHTANVGGFHIAVYVVGEVRSSVFGGHLKQELVVLGLRPVKVTGDGIGGNGILESASVSVALDHDLDKRAVDHIHFLLTVAVLEVHLLAANDRVLVCKVMGYRPVERNVGEGRLRTPTAGGIHAVDKGLDALLHRIIGEIVCLDEGCKIGIKGGECLRARPLVLHDAEEVYHLVAKSCQMLCGCRGDLAGNTAKTFLDELLERPTCAVTGQHRKVMQVNIGIFVCLCDLIVVDLGEPVVCCDSARVGKDQTANRVGHGGVLLHTPVNILYIFINQILVVKDSGLHVTQLFTLTAVKDISLCHIRVACLYKHGLNAVLNVLNRYQAVGNLGLKVGGDLQCEKVDDVIVKLAVAGFKRLFDRFGNLGNVKIGNFAVSFVDAIHVLLLFLK